MATGKMMKEIWHYAFDKVEEDAVQRLEWSTGSYHGCVYVMPDGRNVRSVFGEEDKPVMLEFGI